MGDRAMIGVRYDDDTEPQLFFYTHWEGMVLPAKLQMALMRKQRWTDPGYLARIIFCELVGDNNWNEETGYGISTTTYGDIQYDYLVVDMPSMTVERVALAYETGADFSKPVQSWTFEDFCDLDLIGSQNNWAVLSAETSALCE